MTHDPDLTPEGIRTLRERLGLTQAQFAERLGCSAQAVSFWERGTRSPTGLYARAVRELLAEVEGAEEEVMPPSPPGPGGAGPARR
jgi:DNA-binding transcriptional regulator YiaG